MGRGQRHSKNAGTMGVEGLTYHEKRALGFGTVKERLGKVWSSCSNNPTCCRCSPLHQAVLAVLQDAIGSYYDCRLTLRPVVVSKSAQHSRGSEVQSQS